MNNSVHYCFLTLYCMLETFHHKNVKKLRQEYSCGSPCSTLDTYWVQSQGSPHFFKYLKDFSQGLWGLRDAICNLAQS